jgi:CheY-like chemotaxis protein
MDGFEATAIIRRKEEASGDHIPIIAMTAHAMKGDRQRCLDAGMDGYIPKPIRAQGLYEVVETMAAGRPCPQAEGIEGNEETIDPDRIRELTGGSVETLKEVVEIFRAECPKLMQRIRDAITNEDPAQLQRAAHTLKGSVQVFGLKRPAAAALRLETIGREKNLDDAEQAWSALVDEIERLRPMLTDLLGS